MNDVFFVRIDVPRLCERLSRAEQARRRISHGDAFVWLVEHGFKMTRRGWLARQDALESIEESELVSRDRML